MRTTRYLLFLFCLVIINKAVGQLTEYDSVLVNCNKEELSQKLINFRKGGIEKKTFQYDIDKVVANAKKFIGTKHLMGGKTQSGIDCSGLVYVVHQMAGVQLPRSSQEQARFGTVIYGFNKLQKGDLVFFYNSYQTTNFITHVGIYTGNGDMIHVSSKRGVIVSKVNDPYYWGERYLFATRLMQK